MVLFDQAVFNFLRSFYNENLTFIVKIITNMGSTIVIISGILLVLFILRKKTI